MDNKKTQSEETQEDMAEKTGQKGGKSSQTEEDQSEESTYAQGEKGGQSSMDAQSELGRDEDETEQTH